MTTTPDPIAVFLAFPWYTDPALLNHRKPQCEEECFFKLITPGRNLLPFHIIRPRSPDPITSWEILCPDGSDPIALDESLIKIFAADDGDHIIYEGLDLGIDLPAGYHISILTDGTNTFYSEMFYVECELQPSDDTCWLVTETGEAIVTEQGENINVCNL